ncbi:nucleotidyltransferase family protein [Nocardioides cynanchi]|uniref:nucleotidyltransferase family protein n=1 Tax=Nocardioides cynanchi TaxID=2558918 RepID=UPI001EE20EE5|nr:nucleotidyltransferase family protein [Nocardioides cynanchi]
MSDGLHDGVAALVLAAGASRRLGTPKQLLDYRGGTLLDATLATVRAAGFEQVVVALGGAADQVRDRLDLGDLDVVVNPDFADGCATSIRSGLDHVHPAMHGLVLLLGDQPGVTVDAIVALVAGSRCHEVGVCSYDDGLGHPLWFDRSMWETLRGLHGDKAVWKLVDAGEAGADVVRVQVPGAVPRDVDTWEDYQALLREAE